MSTYSNTAREVEMPNGDVVVLHSAPTGGANTTSNIKKFKYDDNGHVTESEAANATDLNLNSYSTPTTGSTAIGTSDAVQTAIGKLDHQSQIDQSNILYGLEHGSKNQLNFDSWEAQGTGITWKLNDDKTITATGTATSLSYITLKLNNNYVFADAFCDGLHYLSGCPTGGDFNTKYSLYLAKGSYNPVDTGTGVLIPTTSETEVRVVIKIASGFAIPSGGITFKPMICLKSVYDAYPEYQSYGAPNYDLTYLQAEDRAALAEVVDSGAKNVWNFPDASYESRNSLTVTDNSDGSKTFTAENGSWQRAVYKVNVPTTGRYCLVFSVKNSSLPSPECYIFATPNNSSSNNRYGSIQITGNGNYTTEFNVTGDLYIWVYLNYGAGTENNSITLYNVMLCTKAAFGVSQKFVPYRLPYDDVQSKTTLLMNNMGGLTFQGSDLNTLVAGGRYLVNNATDNPVSNAPYNSWQTVEVFQSDYSTYPKVYYQIATDVTGATVTSKWRRRVYNSGGQYNAWTAWSS